MPNFIAQLDIGNVLTIVCLFALGVKYHMAYRRSEKFYKKALKSHRRNMIMQDIRAVIGA